MPVDPQSVFSVRIPRLVLPGRIGLVILAAAAVPILWKELTKQAKKGREEEQGKKDDASGDRPEQKAKAEATASRPTATKREASEAAGARPRASSPPGRKETEAAGSAKGSQSPPRPRQPRHSTVDKAPGPDQPLNPKKTRPRKPKDA